MHSGSESNKFRVAILGAGVISGPHAIALKQVRNAELAAICDLDENKARALQQQYGVEHVFSDLRTMLEQVRPDVVHVLLPPAAHANAAITCLSMGSHVFVEKPLCVSGKECAEMQVAAERAGRLIGVNHNLTFMPGVLKIVDLIRNCRFGAIEHVAVNFNLAMPRLASGPHSHWMFADTRNLIYELGPHPLSVICQLVGPVEEVKTQTTGQLRLSNGATFYNTWLNSMVCQRGTAQLLLSVGKAYTNPWIHILGEDAEAFIDLRRCTVRFSERTRYIRVDDLLDSWKNASSLMRQSLANFREYSAAAIGIRPPYSWQQISIDNSVAAFYAALGEGRRLPMGSPEGAAVVQACDKIAQSGLTNSVESSEVVARG